MTPERLRELRALAEKATPGPWYVVGHPWNPDGPAYIIAGQSDPHVGRPVCDFAIQRDDDTGEPDTEDNGYADADLVAALYPATVLALLSIAEAAMEAETALGKCNELFDEIRGDWSDPRSACREGWAIIGAALARLRKARGA